MWFKASKVPDSNVAMPCETAIDCGCSKFDSYSKWYSGSSESKAFAVRGNFGSDLKATGCYIHHYCIHLISFGFQLGLN